MSGTTPSGDRFDWGEMVEEVTEAEEIRARQPQPGDGLLDAGKWLVGGCAGFLLIGNLVVRVLFPDLLGTGLKLEILVILIPLWSLGAVGLVLLFIGYLVRSRAKRRKKRGDRSKRHA